MLGEVVEPGPVSGGSAGSWGRRRWPAGASGVVKLGRGWCGPRCLAVHCGRWGGLHRGLGPELLAAASCGARDRGRWVAGAWPRN